ncbi:T9SS type A sorting domain-containing protein [Cesiribacter andamanensis]|uniref:Secretion system C-terminal sorting domain-containing protein n=1 Tax=Cesiribacter andamanensis AMV16 TaxID=1279009 RepID=M7N8Z0_9BACT|nr:T9SS type A sorting domain-containing protein [Cesiribacter andamanensis]EMR03676.1 hypothetical protein ADICEAN_01197 [Cesiribacter andamanensis AMV16]
MYIPPFLRIAGFLLCVATAALAQTPGAIYQATVPATSPLNPNGDGWISGGAAFTTATGETPMEVPYVAIPQFSLVEPNGDTRTGGSCGNTDVVDRLSVGASASYVYYTSWSGVPIMQYRMRIAQNATGAFGFSVLVDVDGRIGTSDPNYIAPGGNKPGNPGFEFEIAYVTGGGSNGVVVYDVDGATTGVEVARYSLSTHSQRSYALFSNCTGQAPVFYDFWVPISAMGLTNSSTIRLAAATTSQPGSIFGNVSDIAGVADALFPVPDDAFIALVNLQNPTPVSNLGSSGCFINGTTAAPVASGELFDSQRLISGTSSEANGTVISLSINGAVYATTTVTSGNWSFNLPRYLLRPFDQLSFTAKNACKYISTPVLRFVLDDLDSDGDGIPDIEEGRGKDPGADDDGDRIPNFMDSDYPGFVDSNGDGINDYFDADGDGIPNHYDLDSDNDGIPDVVEAGGRSLDANADGRIDSQADVNLNGLADALEAERGGTPLRNPDTDRDGLPDFLDLDADGDGLSDLVEAGGTDSDRNGRVDGFTDANQNGLHDGREGSLLPLPDTDADGLANYLDIDSDGDGIPDNREGQSTAAYRTPLGLDANSNGLDDAYDPARGGTGLLPVNTDGDALPDYLDPDSDNDGISDLIEGNDANRDGRADRTPFGQDTDGDGLDNAFDSVAPGSGNALGSNVALQNTDGTDEPDWRDADDDNDGTPSRLEDTNANGRWDDDFSNGGGIYPNYLYHGDSDRDGVMDTADADSDNDGIPDLQEDGGTGYDPKGFTGGSRFMNYMNALLPGFVDSNNDGINDRFDRDLDGIPDFLDLDSDNDGIPDLVEAGGVDTNGDGIVDTFTDTNRDGLHDPLLSSPLPLPDTDGDGLRNYLDIDSDGDGIPDNREAQRSANHRLPRYADTNRNGLDDAYEAATGGQALVPVNTDGDALPDYLDPDSDGDGIADAIEGFDFNKDGIADRTPSGQDTDRDGLDNAYDTLAPGRGNALGSNAPLQDTDGDGWADWQDTDDDGDGLPTLSEGFNFVQGGRPSPDYLYRADADADGVVDLLDIDADNDGIANAQEDGGTGYNPTADHDGDGIQNYRDRDIPGFVDSNGDGINDRFDTDGDGIPDFLDLDSDNDGMPDLVEAGGSDPDGDGRIAGPFAANGLATSLNGQPLQAPDTDGDGLRNPYDLDSDGDGIPDLLENRGPDSNKDGRIDGFTDTNRNGLDDRFESLLGGTPLLIRNTDGDDQPNYLDLDSDGDGLFDLVEAGGQDANGDGRVDAAQDTNRNGLADAVDPARNNGPLPLADADGDGLPNAYDQDSDGDGIPDSIEARTTAGVLVARGVDSDGDGIPDYLDLDSDNDGISDLIEGNDANRDGRADRLPTGLDSDGDGWDNAFDTSTGGLAPVRQDSDSDGRPDYRDNDDDNDGIPTIDEPLDIAPANGVRDYLENRVGSCGLGFITAPFSGNADDLQFSSEVQHPQRAVGSADGTISGGTISNAAILDNTADVLVLDLTDLVPLNRLITIRWYAPSGHRMVVSGGSVATAFSNPATYTSSQSTAFASVTYTVAQAAGVRYLRIVVPANSPVYIDAVSYQYDLCLADYDNDGVSDLLDLDDDNDGIPDLLENNGLDASGDHDGDGVPNFRDAQFPGFADLNRDGIDDRFDADGDGIPNHFDLDSDNDGIPDAVEAYGGRFPANMTQNGTFTLAFIRNYDSNRDGLANPVDPQAGGSAFTRPDTDADQVRDLLDWNSDNDPQPDWVEAFDDDTNGDALNDLLARALLWETVNGNPGIYTRADADGDGIPNWMEDDDNDGIPNFLDPTAGAYYRDTNRNGLVDLFDVLISGKATNLPDRNRDGIADYRQISVIITLPVEMLHFGATTSPEGVLLQWRTAQEKNNAGFEVERSADGRAFQQIGYQPGAGTTNNLQHYTYLDKGLAQGVYYYRLKQVDYDGTYKYSAIVRVAWTGNTADILQVSPNPVRSLQLKALLGVPQAGSVHYRIRNLQGQVVQQAELYLSSPASQLEIPLHSELINGVYVLEISTNTGRQSQRFVLLQ